MKKGRKVRVDGLLSLIMGTVMVQANTMSLLTRTNAMAAVPVLSSVPIQR